MSLFIIFMTLDFYGASYSFSSKNLRYVKRIFMQSFFFAHLNNNKKNAN